MANNTTMKERAFIQDVNYAMEVPRKSRLAFAAANLRKEEAQYKEVITSVQTAVDFSFQDVEGLLHLVRLAMEAIGRLISQPSLRLCEPKRLLYCRLGTVGRIFFSYFRSFVRRHVEASWIVRYAVSFKVIFVVHVLTFRLWHLGRLFYLKSRCNCNTWILIWDE